MGLFSKPIHSTANVGWREAAVYVAERFNQFYCDEECKRWKSIDCYDQFSLYSKHITDATEADWNYALEAIDNRNGDVFKLDYGYVTVELVPVGNSWKRIAQVTIQPNEDPHKFSLGDIALNAKQKAAFINWIDLMVAEQKKPAKCVIVRSDLHKQGSVVGFDPIFGAPTQEEMDAYLATLPGVSQ